MKNNRLLYVLIILLTLWCAVLSSEISRARQRESANVVNQYEVDGFSTDLTKVIDEVRPGIVTISADNNILLGKLTVEVPVGPKGQEAIEITYTYDIDALLEVEVKVLSTGVTKNAVIHDEEKQESEEEKASRAKRLEYLKFNPREDEENMLVMLRADRVYEESLSEDRKTIEELIEELQKALDEKNIMMIEINKKKLTELLDEIENGKNDHFIA